MGGWEGERRTEERTSKVSKYYLYLVGVCVYLQNGEGGERGMGRYPTSCTAQRVMITMMTDCPVWQHPPLLHCWQSRESGQVSVGTHSRTRTRGARGFPVDSTPTAWACSWSRFLHVGTRVPSRVQVAHILPSHRREAGKLLIPHKGEGGNDTASGGRSRRVGMYVPSPR